MLLCLSAVLLLLPCLSQHLLKDCSWFMYYIERSVNISITRSVNISITRITNNIYFCYVATSDDISTHANFQVDGCHGCHGC